MHVNNMRMADVGLVSSSASLPRWASNGFPAFGPALTHCFSFVCVCVHGNILFVRYRISDAFFKDGQLEYQKTTDTVTK
jgi:hypothetical protein